jgi:hypothetical protein
MRAQFPLLEKEQSTSKILYPDTENGHFHASTCQSLEEENRPKHILLYKP